ncbi:MAG: N(4)-(beta-N-acetylglucosaminyl)-L-asparaginase [Flammeovirgaceae bacterium]|nr:N(4)-(beta-N-acetylglucosaminyl)-L-asparaginase [Flammeovirgaceae bacterium]
MKRRDFIKKSTLFSSAYALPKSSNPNDFDLSNPEPVVISTWDHGLFANRVSWDILAAGGKSLDAVEEGVRVVESDPNIRTVGMGGYPDREGIVTLDACIMDYESNCGSVAFLRDIVNPISVARKVMEETPHVMLVGEGAKKFALKKGFKEINLLTDLSRKEWNSWKTSSKYESIINIENHDTISSLALSGDGRLAGACTTSGSAYKMHGRVGDSPIIGAGLFLDNQVGAAAATGLGEAVIKSSGSAMVVEAMRNGASPQDACQHVILRILKMNKQVENLQVGFIALDIRGNVGAFSIKKGFNYALSNQKVGHLLLPANYLE